MISAAMKGTGMVFCYFPLFHSLINLQYDLGGHQELTLEQDHVYNITHTARTPSP